MSLWPTMRSTVIGGYRSMIPMQRGAEDVVLFVGEGVIRVAFELDADGEIVASRPALKGALSRVPCRIVRIDELMDPTVPFDEKMGGYAKIPDGFERRMEPEIQMTGEKIDHVRGAEFSGRQADIMDHDHIDIRPPSRRKMGTRPNVDGDFPAFPNDQGLCGNRFRRDPFHGDSVYHADGRYSMRTWEYGFRCD